MTHGSMPGVMVDLLPSSIRWIWVWVFLFVIAVHLLHPLRVYGVHRLWHSGHLLMAIGMIHMFLPEEFKGGSHWAWEFVFAAATVLAGGFAALKLRQGTVIDLPWVTLTVDLGIMVYMLAMMDGATWAPVTYGAAIWSAAEAVGWFVGGLCGRRDDSWLPKAIGPRGGGGEPAATVRYLAGATPIAYDATQLSRTTLGLMALGMAYMLIAMQLMM